MKFLLPLLLAACPAPTDTSDTAKTEDVDGDGYTVGEGDCDDTNPDAHPHGDEVYYDGVDGDCEGLEDEYDQDLDGVELAEDCNDEDPTVQPGAAEECDGVDNDCDGTIDVDPVDGSTWYPDSDGDTYGDLAAPMAACGDAPEGYVADGTDCDDTDVTVHPGATDTCGNGVDEDCDGSDSTLGTIWYQDTDGDGFGTDATTATECNAPTGYVAEGGDCDDVDATVNPGADEACDDLDNNCNGRVDEGIATDRYYPDVDLDGFGSTSGAVTDCVGPAGYLTTSGDCDDADATVNPDAVEVCDGIDNNCDRDVDEGVSYSYYSVDKDADGYGVGPATIACELPEGAITMGGDCNDSDASVSPGAAEVCDSADNDCDGAVDDGVLVTFWTTDTDGDGYGVGKSGTACEAPEGTVSGGLDCDDGDAAVNPGATETCDGVDNDCDRVVDDRAGCYEDSGVAYMGYYGTVQTSSGAFLSGSFGAAFFAKDSGDRVCSILGDFTDTGGTPKGCPGCDWSFTLQVGATAEDGGVACASMAKYDADFSGLRGDFGFAPDFDLYGDGSYLTAAILYGYRGSWYPVAYNGSPYSYVDGDAYDSSFARMGPDYRYYYYY